VSGVDERIHLRRRDDVETAILPDASCLLFDPVTNNGHALNAAGALIWDYCDGALSAGAIADELAEMLPDVAEMRDQALDMVATLLRLGLVLPLG
jgi:hypothetical protein